MCQLSPVCLDISVEFGMKTCVLQKTSLSAYAHQLTWVPDKNVLWRETSVVKKMTRISVGARIEKTNQDCLRTSC